MKRVACENANIQGLRAGGDCASGRGEADIPCFGRGEIRETAVTTEGKKVHIPAVLVTNKSLRHE